MIRVPGLLIATMIMFLSSIGVSMGQPMLIDDFPLAVAPVKNQQVFAFSVRI